MTDYESDRLTVLTAASPCNKQVVRHPDGTIAKGFAPNTGYFTAYNVDVPDLEAFEQIIRRIADRPTNLLVLGYCKHAVPEHYEVIPRKAMAKALGCDERDDEKLLGVHEINGEPTVVRLKENFALSSWTLFDFDVVPGMPAELANLDRDAWLAAMDQLLPGFAGARKLIMPSTSARVTVDGKPLEAVGRHAYVQLADVEDMASRVWKQLVGKARVTMLPDTDVPLGFQRTLYDNQTGEPLKHGRGASIFDNVTLQTNRPVFVGKPIVIGEGLAVIEPDISIVEGDRLDTTAFKDLTERDQAIVEEDFGLRYSFTRTGRTGKVTGVEVVEAVLTPYTAVLTDSGWRTIKELLDADAKHVRCESPFRLDSNSSAAFFGRHKDGSPFVYDCGLAAKYVLADFARGISELDFSHDGLALGLGLHWAGDAQYVPLFGKWIFWNGTLWRPDEKLLHMTRTRDYLRARGDHLVRNVERRPDADDKDVQRAKRAAKSLRDRGTVAAVADLWRSNEGTSLDPNVLDADPLLLGGPVTCDLRNGTTYPPRRGDLITKGVAVAPAEPGTLAPVWQRCLTTWTGGDTELEEYLQRLCAYILTGSVEEHALIFTHGPGGNGKTTFWHTIAGILGDYAKTLPAEALMMSRNDRHPTEFAMLRGARLALASEIEEGAAWAESKIKSLTGGDTVVARFMRCDFFEFQPTFKLVVLGNHKPSLRTVDDAVKRRFHLVPFTAKIADSDRVKDLDTVLRHEWPAILRWALDGIELWQLFGLSPPKCVVEATNQYLDEEDQFSLWLAERTERADESVWCGQAYLFGDWYAWATSNGVPTRSSTWLGQQLEKRGYKRKDRSQGRVVLGIRVKTVASAST